jgi:chromate transporter
MFNSALSKNIYIQLFISFLKIGAFTIGGGYAMIPLIEKEVVENKKWLAKQYFIDMLALAQSAPGVMTVNTSIFVGYKIKGFWGAVVAVLGTVLPSFVIILLIATFYIDFKDNPIVERIFKGIRPAVVALIVTPLLNMSKSIRITMKTVIITLLAMVLTWQFNVSPVYIIVGAIASGLIYKKFRDCKGRKAS